MDAAFATRIVCDISLWYCAAGLLFVPSGAAASAALPFSMALCCVISCALCEKRAALRFIPLPLLILSFFFIGRPLDIFTHLPPALYCAWLCVRAEFSPDYESSSGYFKTTAIALPAAVLFFLIFGGAARVSVALKYLVVFLFSGVLMLRILRHDERNRREWRLHIIDLALLLLCCAAALILSSGAFLGAVGSVAGFLYRSVAAPLLLGLAYVLSYIFLFFSKLFNVKSVTGEPPKLNSENLDLTSIFGEDAAAEAGSRFPIKLVTALGIVLFIVFAFLLFRRLAKGAGRKSAHLSAASGVSLSPAEDAAPLFSLAPRTPRESVRRCYKRFLLLLKSRGFSLSPADTSESVLSAAAGYYDVNLARELREIYIRARYSPSSVTREDAKRAKELCAKLKSSSALRS